MFPRRNVQKKIDKKCINLYNEGMSKNKQETFNDPFVLVEGNLNDFTGVVEKDQYLFGGEHELYEWLNEIQYCQIDDLLDEICHETLEQEEFEKVFADGYCQINEFKTLGQRIRPDLEYVCDPDIHVFFDEGNPDEDRKISFPCGILDRELNDCSRNFGDIDYERSEMGRFYIGGNRPSLREGEGMSRRDEDTPENRNAGPGFLEVYS